MGQEKYHELPKGTQNEISELSDTNKILQYGLDVWHKYNLDAPLLKDCTSLQVELLDNWGRRIVLYLDERALGVLSGDYGYEELRDPPAQYHLERRKTLHLYDALKEIEARQ